AAEARDALAEQQLQRLQAFVDDVAALQLRIGLQRLELLAVGADADADLEPALAEMVEGGDLLGRHHDVMPHRQHQHAGTDLDGLGFRQDEGVGDQRLPETRRHRELGAHVVLGRHVVVTPHRVVAEPLGRLGDLVDVLRIGERNGIGQAFHSGRQAGTDPHRDVPPAYSAARARSLAVSAWSTVPSSFSATPESRRAASAEMKPWRTSAATVVTGRRRGLPSPPPPGMAMITRSLAGTVCRPLPRSTLPDDRLT